MGGSGVRVLAAQQKVMARGFTRGAKARAWGIAGEPQLARNLDGQEWEEQES